MSRKAGILLLLCLFSYFNPISCAADITAARWITCAADSVNKPNTWIAFRHDISLDKVPQEAIVRIGADTKYWLWLNGQLVVFEGGLKRGPTPHDTYYDEIDLAPFLHKGNNKIALLLWYFGKEGFSHKDSGQLGAILSSISKDFNLASSHDWLCRIHPAFGDTGEPYPNFRLAESNIRFDARKDIEGWQTAEIRNLNGFLPAQEIGSWGDTPWNNLIKRPIPQWKDFGIKDIAFKRYRGRDTDSIVVDLPYNMQMTPIITIADSAGDNLIGISTDHSFAGSTFNVRAEYITKKGKQVHESLGWMNGEKIILKIPKDVSVKNIAYRETGYDTYPEGTFTCNSDFYNRFWQKALRTLYVNMRDTYFDCPDRERAQWWGDVVVLMGESFYSYSTSAHALMRKAILELASWQKPDGVLFSPIPAGNYDSELPSQMLASIGRYGFWNYYTNTGDRATIAEVYPAVKKYLSLWELDKTGLTQFREGGWPWGDWGENRDMRLIFAGWHYLALEGAANMANLLGYDTDAAAYQMTMEKVKKGYNQCWNGSAYRHPDYNNETDDRVQALAVISGIASSEYYQPILTVLQTEFHASPYMEKYVMEALFCMQQSHYALERTEKRFGDMVNNTEYTTLFEGWGIGNEGYGGGTTNHAWSGGTLTIIARYLCGIYPLEAGYKTFAIEPDITTSLNDVQITIPTVIGEICFSFRTDSKKLDMEISVPERSKAILYLPIDENDEVLINGVRRDPEDYELKAEYQKNKKTAFLIKEGKYTISCTYK